MKSKIAKRICVFTLILLFTHVVSVAAKSNPGQDMDIYITSVEGNFEEYKELLKLTITNRGIKISNTSYISNMLQRTKTIVNASDDIFVNAEAVEFCSATLSRKMMAANPHNILYCPYIIYIYEVADEPGVVYLAFRKLQLNGSVNSQQALKQVNTLLKNIIAETVE